MVDTKTSENALRIALEAREMGIDTITELEYQAGTSILRPHSNLFCFIINNLFIYLCKLTHET